MDEEARRIRLPLGTRLGFGICDLGGNLFFTMMSLYLVNFMTDTVKLAAGLAGTAVAVGRIWDAFVDPAVGAISDRTRTRWGRRRPFLFVGAIVLFFLMAVMFSVPHFRTQTATFVWLTVVWALLGTSYSLVNIPYGALTPELTADFNERTVLNGFRMGSAVFGTFIAGGLVLPLVGAFGSPEAGWPAAGAIMGGVMLVTAMITFFTVREPARSTPRRQEAVFRSYLAVLKQRVFLLALLPWMLHTLGVTIVTGALIYYFRYLYGNEGAFSIALPLLLVGVLVFIPVWVAVSKRIGKKLAYNLGMGFFACMLLLFFFLGPSLGVTFAYVVMFLAGIGFSTNYVMPWSIVPDVAENDYAENGLRREGVFYGLWTFAAKVGQALGAAAVGWLLGAFGYAPNVAQSGLSLLGIRLLCGPIPALFFVLGIVVLSFYPINRAYYDRIAAKAREREAG